jgi:hypothetical protein
MPSPKAHDTPARESASPPSGFGVVCSAHLEPFHRSAQVSIVLSSTPTSYEPTAVHAFLDVHAMAFSAAHPPHWLWPGGLAASWIDQLEPFQWSTTGATLSPPPPTSVSADPTATQLTAEVHATPLYVKAMSPSSAFGVGSILHREPLNRPARFTGPTSF